MAEGAKGPWRVGERSVDHCERVRWHLYQYRARPLAEWLAPTPQHLLRRSRAPSATNFLPTWKRAELGGLTGGRCQVPIQAEGAKGLLAGGGKEVGEISDG